MIEVLLVEIKRLSEKYEMVLNWDKINNAGLEELEKVLGLIHRVYSLR